MKSLGGELIKEASIWDTINEGWKSFQATDLYKNLDQGWSDFQGTDLYKQYTPKVERFWKENKNPIIGGAIGLGAGALAGKPLLGTLAGAGLGYGKQRLNQSGIHDYEDLKNRLYSIPNGPKRKPAIQQDFGVVTNRYQLPKQGNYATSKHPVYEEYKQLLKNRRLPIQKLGKKSPARIPSLYSEIGGGM